MKDEVRAEMQHDREEMFRMKAEVDAVQEEVLSDLQQVNSSTIIQNRNNDELRLLQKFLFVALICSISGQRTCHHSAY